MAVAEAELRPSDQDAITSSSKTAQFRCCRQEVGAFLLPLKLSWRLWDVLVSLTGRGQRLKQSRPSSCQESRQTEDNERVGLNEAPQTGFTPNPPGEESKEWCHSATWSGA